MPRTRQKSVGWRSAVQRMQEALAAREHEELRKRYQCDLLQFWRGCRDAPCRRRRTCKGDPHRCLARGLAAMSEPDKEWLRGAIMATVRGPRTMQELVRWTNEEIAAARRSRPMKPADALKLAARLKAQLLPIAEPAGLSPSGEADAAASVLVPARESPASPATPAAEPALPAADPSAPAGRRGSGPSHQLLACCDEEGRLIIPDLTEQKERVQRGLSWSEIVARGRV
ncbi:MAG: hypothetical protein K2Z80_05445 [Xanthobacteraceae bacterium]|nr:hypothetical protein [Xanthobacteraceae bacterium]MBX9841236.1 hypothetical protein [Xanthobacteraceae bacterium]